MFIKTNINKEDSLKDRIISILGVAWPLKIKQIHVYLKKEYNIDVSYQSVHKAINKLKEANLLIETDNGWQISTEWINQSYDFLHKLKDSYKNTLFNPLKDNMNITSINFKTLAELDEFYFSLSKNLIASSKSRTIIFCQRHNWRPILYPKKEYGYIEKERQYYFLVDGNTELDKWCTDFEKNLGAKAKNSLNYTNICDTYVIGDNIIQVFIPKNLMEKIDLLFNSSKDIANINIHQIIKDVFERNDKITVVINRNEELSRQIKNQILNIFNN